MDPAEIFLEAAKSRQRGLHEATVPGNSPIQEFYHHSTVFVTGGSGFLGKQLLEKLLRSCDIRRIYILLRARNGKDIKQRLFDVLKDPVYDTLRQTDPGFEDRMTPIEGDVANLKLGLSDHDWETITKEASVIFHGAATIRFNEPLEKAVLTNVRGTREILTLARACKNLRAMVYISTAYSHATADRIGKELSDVFYTVPIRPATLIELVETVEPARVEKITKELIVSWPNTYSFSKAVAEDAVRIAGDDLPVCVVRPTIVVGAYREPSPGWIENSSVYGPSGLTLGCTMGVIHVVCSRPNVKVDIMPVDYVNNAIIAVAWETGRRWVNTEAGRKTGERETRVYNVVSARNGITFGDLSNVLNNEMRNFISPKAIWRCFAFETPNRYLHWFYTLLIHFIPACVVDNVLALFGKNPGLLRLYKKIYKMSRVLTYFTLNEWHFQDGNTVALHKNMSETDRKIFHFDISDVNMKELVVLWAMGLRKFIVKDGLKNTEYGLSKQTMFLIVTYAMLSMFVLSLGVPMYHICMNLQKKLYLCILSVI